jgi:hypothetical protein
MCARVSSLSSRSRPKETQHKLLQNIIFMYTLSKYSLSVHIFNLPSIWETGMILDVKDDEVMHFL